LSNNKFRWQAVGATIKNKKQLMCRLCKLAVYANDPDTKVQQTTSLLKSSYKWFMHGHPIKDPLKRLLLRVLCADMQRYPNGVTGFNWSLIYIFSNNIMGDMGGRKNMGRIVRA